MNIIKNVKILPLTESKFVTPMRMTYVENKTEKIWDLVQVHPSVTVIIFNVTRSVLVCVKQFRPGVYLSKIPADDRSDIDCVKYPRELGVTLEWCSGIVDKDKSLEEIASEEVLEECGYRIDPDKLERIQSFHCSVGVTGDRMNLYFAAVTDDMKVAAGGGLPEEGELIDVVELPVSKAFSMFDTPAVDASVDFLYGLMWFFNKKFAYYNSNGRNNHTNLSNHNRP